MMLNSVNSTEIIPTCPVVKYAENTDIIVAFLSMHDSSSFDTTTRSRNIINKFNEYLKIFGKKNENGKGYKTKIVFISMWATDPTSRDKGYQLPGSLNRAEDFYNMQYNTIQYYKKDVLQDTYFVDIFNITMGAMDQTNDGVHLYDECPRSEIARKVVGAIVATEKDS